MNIITYRHAPGLGGALPHMAVPATQRRWDACLAAIYGLPLDREGLAAFCEHTGRQLPRPGGYSEAVIITGRQSGKTQTATDIVAFEAITAPADRSADGTYALLIAQDQRGAQRTLFRYASLPFEHVPMLAEMRAGATADTITLRNGITLACYPCRPAAVRGIRARVAVIDELAFFRTSDGNPVDTEMLRAVRPTLATTGGKLIILSSPYGQSGALWDLYRQHYAREHSDTLVWVASAPAMHPGLRADYLQRMQQDDPEAYRSEVLGEFRAGLSTLFDAEALDAVRGDWHVLPPAPAVTYYAFADCSGGKTDAAALAIAHVQDGQAIVDLCRRWPAPHNPETVIGEAAALAQSYRCHAVTADRYAAEFQRAAWERAGLRFEACDQDRSGLYLCLLPMVLSTAVRVPDDAVVLRELRGLERKRGFGGRDRVDHRPGAHDDAAVALAGAVYVASRAAQYALTIEPGGTERTSPRPWTRAESEDPFERGHRDFTFR
jgi:hypothetical protein